MLKNMMLDSGSSRRQSRRLGILAAFTRAEVLRMVGVCDTVEACERFSTDQRPRVRRAAFARALTLAQRHTLGMPSVERLLPMVDVCPSPTYDAHDACDATLEVNHDAAPLPMVSAAIIDPEPDASGRSPATPSESSFALLVARFTAEGKANPEKSARASMAARARASNPSGSASPTGRAAKRKAAAIAAE